MLFLAHVYKIHYDYAAQIPEPDLVRYFLRRFQVYFQGCVFRICFPCIFTAVDVNNSQGFSPVKYEICTALKVYFPGKGFI